MSLLSKKGNLSYLGIDIGTASIKMVELENYNGQPKLRTYGYADVTSNILRGTVEKNNQAIADYINLIAQEANVKTKKVIAALPTFSVFNFIINLPNMPKKDLDAAVKWEAKKFIPLPIEEMILDWKILNKEDNKEDKKSVGDLLKKEIKKPEEKKPEEKKLEEKKLEEKKPEEKKIGPIEAKSKNFKILLTAAPKSLVSRYIDIFKKAELNLLSLETESFALSRALLGNDKSIVMIVDLGATTTDICVVEGGVPILNRGIDTGGEFITKSIMNSLNISLDRADQFKRDFGLSVEDSNKSVPAIIKKSLDFIINEIKYAFELYQRQGNNKIDKIILSGGSAFLPNLPNYLTELLGLPVIIGDPWDRIIYPLDLKPILSDIGPRMATCIGLSMRDIN